MKLELRPIEFAEARDFIARYHRHHDPPVSWRFGIAVVMGGGRYRGDHRGPSRKQAPRRRLDRRSHALLHERDAERMLEALRGCLACRSRDRLPSHAHLHAPVGVRLELVCQWVLTDRTHEGRQLVQTFPSEARPASDRAEDHLGDRRMIPARPILRYFGGKWLLAPWIISHMPAHRIYVEPFGGGASVLLRKSPSYAEIYNDLDGEIVNVFRVVRDQGRELRARLEATPFAREEFDLAHEPAEDPLEQARRSIVRSFMGHGADSLTRRYKSGFRAVATRNNRHPARDWVNYAPALDTIQARLMGVVIENRDALEVMAAQDGTETLHYVDPPYPHATRTASRWGKHGYRHELSDQEHVALCDALCQLRGMVLLSGYPTPLYERLGWQRFTRKHYADGAVERTEVLWINPAAATARVQGNLFEVPA